jgi:hypothetical protein
MPAQFFTRTVQTALLQKQLAEQSEGIAGIDGI